MRFSHKKMGIVQGLRGQWCNECRSVVQPTTYIRSRLTCDDAGKMNSSWKSMGSTRPSIWIVTPCVVSTSRVIMSCIKLNALKGEFLNTTMHFHKNC